ncbi:YheC/YheD family protein [Paenibacillus terrae]|uniref:YheC/YheD family endospore coat-associated protein n=1 Tax=Paenibacillus terrae TaxID=159743 RepID=UPI0011EA9ECB|nr:YheC/YheD family protein [Paenibacillus terrae]
MSIKKTTIQIIGSGILQDDVLMVGESLLRKWKISAGHPVQLAFGSFRQQVTVISVPRYRGLRVGSVLARKMGLHANCELRVTYSRGRRTLRVGPLISVLVSRDYPEQPDKPFGSITLFCRELIGECRRQGAYVYFFTPEHIGNQPGRVQGWVYDGGWKKTVMPAGDVVNNRLTSRKLENRTSVQHFMKEVKSQYGTAIFNEKFLDKNEVFDALKSNSSLRKYLPESHLLQTFAVFKKMCHQYPTVFLKPVRGSLGKGIMRITKQADGTFCVLSTTAGTPRKQMYPNIEKLYKGLAGKMKMTRFQLQQGLTLIDHGKRPVDFRALVQKNASGAWTVTSIVARIAGGSHFVSNLARGGTLSTVKEALAKTTLPALVKSNGQTHLKTAALEIANGVEKAIPAHFAEFGIDLAIDSTGHIWLLEVNSKPSKNDNTPLNDQKTRPSVKKMIEYCCYSAGFK